MAGYWLRPFFLMDQDKEKNNELLFKHLDQINLDSKRFII